MPQPFSNAVCPSQDCSWFAPSSLPSLSRSSSQTEYSKSESLHATHLSLRFWTCLRHLLVLGQILQSRVNCTAAGFTQPTTRYFLHLHGMSARVAETCCNPSGSLVIRDPSRRFCSYSFIVSSFLVRALHSATKQ